MAARTNLQARMLVGSKPELDSPIAGDGLVTRQDNAYPALSPLFDHRAIPLDTHVLLDAS